ncbi:hypothetical protein Efla_007572 [Eimeria flavescens]
MRNTDYVESILITEISTFSGLHSLLHQTLECGQTNLCSRRQRLSYVFCDSEETHAQREATPREATEEAPGSESAVPYPAKQLDILGTAGFADGDLQTHQDQSDLQGANGGKCVPARVLFPLDAGGPMKREKGPQRKKIVVIEQLANKGFLKHDWMYRMRTARPSCVILCCDWRKVYEAEPLWALAKRREEVASSGPAAASQPAPSAEKPRPPHALSSAAVLSPSAAVSNAASKTQAEAKAGPQEDEVACAEAEAMATIEFFRDRLQRRPVVPKMIVFVVLPAGMDDPQSAVGFLKRLNPAEIAAIFITCGVDDLRTKLEKLEQVSLDCSLEYYENEARRYRKQTQVTFKGDRSQTSAFHVYQTRCLIKAAYMLEFAQQPHAAMKSYITAWQFLTTYSQMALALERMTVCNLISVRMYPMYFKANEPAKAAHHAREHRAVLRENIPESPLQGYLLPLWLAQLHQLLAQLCEDAMHTNPSALDTRDVWQLAGFHYQAAARYFQHVRSWIKTAKAINPPPSMKGGLCVPSPWLGRPDSLQHGIAAFATSSSQDNTAAAAAAQEEVFLRFIFFFNEAQVLTHATHLLSKAHIAYKLVRGYRSCPILACELADAMFDGGRMMTARQLYFTLATAFASHTYGHRLPWQSEEAPGEGGLIASVPSMGVLEEKAHLETAVNSPAANSSGGDSQQALETRAAAAFKNTLPPGLCGCGYLCRWWPLYRYVLARLTLCASHLLGVPPAEFLYDIARIDSRPGSTLGEAAAAARILSDYPQQAANPAPTAASGGGLGGRSIPTSDTDAESCRITLKAAFQIVNLLALREDLEDPDGAKRKQMHQFLTLVLPRLDQPQQPHTQHGWLLHIDLHAVVVWTAFRSEVHLEPATPDTDLRQPLHASGHQLEAQVTPSSAQVVVGTLCFQHDLGFDLSVLNAAELVTISGRKASCRLENSSSSGPGSCTGEGDLSGPSESASFSLLHGSPSFCEVLLDRQALPGISGSKLRCLHLWWAECPAVCFELSTLCASHSEQSLHARVDQAMQDGTTSPPGPCGRWPPPLRRVLLQHKLCIPPRPFCEIECPGPAESFLPSLCVSKDMFQLASVGPAYSKHLWIGELAPYTVRLTVRRARSFPKLRVCLQCTAHESGAANEQTLDAGRLLEDEFEAFVFDSATNGEKAKASVAAAATDAPGDLCGNGLHNGSCKGVPWCPRLLRISSNKAARLLLVLTKTHAEGGCHSNSALDRQHEAADGDPADVPFVFCPWEYRSMLSDVEWASFVEGDASTGTPGGSIAECSSDREAEEKVVCVPMLIRLRRAGFFEVRVTLDVDVDDVVQRLTAASSVECQRSLELSSSLISLPVASGDEAREARCVTLTNVSEIPLELTAAKMTDAQEGSGATGSPVTYADHGNSLVTSGVPCTLLPRESWSGIMKAKASPRWPSAMLLKYSRTSDKLPFPFRCMDAGITDNVTVARLPPSAKPFGKRYLDISLNHPISSSVGEPFTFLAVLKNQTRSAMELLVCFSYPQAGGSIAPDFHGENAKTISADCPFMISGQLQTQIIVLPQSTKCLHWTLVPSSGLFFFA